jgi:hypothetical protein
MLLAPNASSVPRIDHRGQVLFYANSGPPYASTDTSGAASGGYVSLFLSCEVRRDFFRRGMKSSYQLSPLRRRRTLRTTEGKNVIGSLFRPLDMFLPVVRWVREGLFRFTFELHRSFPCWRYKYILY